MTEHAFGWRPSLPDIRDVPYAQRFAAAIQSGPLPRYVDLHHKCPPIWAQGGLGSCTAHGVSRVFAFDRRKLGFADYMPARLFNYFGSRTLEGTVSQDSGASVRDAMRSAAKWGICDEKLWPYRIPAFKTKPSDAAYKDGAKHIAVEYATLTQSVDFLKACLAQGYVFTFGFTVYQNFDAAGRNGMMAMPSGRVLGGHCITAVGYNSKNYFCLANSWDTSWGDPDMPGHFWMPPEYIAHPQLAADFWVMRTVSA